MTNYEVKQFKIDMILRKEGSLMIEIKNKKSRNIMFIVLLIGSVISSFLKTSLITVLPVIISNFSVYSTSIQWLTSADFLSMGIMIPTTAFLLRRFKTKNLFIFGLGIVGLGLILLVIAATLPIFLLGRILQVMGNCLLLSMAQVVILTIYPTEQMGRIMGIYCMLVGAAHILAPQLTDIVIDLFNWRVIFCFGLVITIIDIILTVFTLKNVLETEKQKFDIISMLLSVASFLVILLVISKIGIDNFFSYSIVLPLLVGIVTLVIFVFRQLYLDEPFLELRILKNREYRLSVIISILLYLVMIAGSTLISIYIQEMYGLSKTISRLVMTPGLLVMMIISPFTGKIYDRFGIRQLVVIGSIFMMFSCIGISFVGKETSLICILLMYIVRLIAISFIVMPIVTWGMSTIETKYISHGTAIFTSITNISGAVGSAVFLAIRKYITKLSSFSIDITAVLYSMNILFIVIGIVSVITIGCIMMLVVKWGISSNVEIKYNSHRTEFFTSLRVNSGFIVAVVFVAFMTYTVTTTGLFIEATANSYGINVAFIGISIVSLIQLIIAIIFVGNKR